MFDTNNDIHCLASIATCLQMSNVGRDFLMYTESSLKSATMAKPFYLVCTMVHEGRHLM